MSKAVRIERNDAILVAIDFQERLLPAMHDREKLESNVIKLAKGIDIFGIPRIVTTQYAKGLGETTKAVAEALGDFDPIDKTSFSAYRNEEFCRLLKKSGRKTIILAGIETHICVEQTALDLIEEGYKVALAADCARSRDEENHRLSLMRLSAAGVTVTSGESILYEILGGAKAAEFKAISAIVK